MNASAFVILTTEAANQVQGLACPKTKRNNGGAHEAAHRPFFTCESRVLGCSVTTGRSLQ